MIAYTDQSDVSPSKYISGSDLDPSRYVHSQINVSSSMLKK